MAQLTIIGIAGKKKGAPPPPPGPAKKRGAAPPPPPDAPGDPGSGDPDPDAAAGGGGQGASEPDADDKAISPAEVGYGENDLCKDCANMGDDGNCAKYNFPVSETGHCLAGYEPKGGGGEDYGQQGPAVAVQS